MPNYLEHQGRVCWTRGNWQIEERSDNGKDFYFAVVNVKTGFVELPILYTDRTVAYDFPERVPAYVKRAVSRILNT